MDSGFHEGADEVHAYAKLSTKGRTRASLPRAFGSSESITITDQAGEFLDQVVKVYKADQTCKYLMISKVRPFTHFFLALFVNDTAEICVFFLFFFFASPSLVSFRRPDQVKVKRYPLD